MKISVALCLYNGEKFILEQLNSIAQQTRKVDEVVICDDSSSDESVQLARDFIKEKSLQDSWRIIQNTKNLGYVKNFYQAISLCQGEYVFLSDQDDIWETDKVEKMCAVLEKNPKIDLLSCDYALVDKKGVLLNERYANARRTGNLKKVLVCDIAKKYRWPGMTMCFRRSFFENKREFLTATDAIHDLALGMLAADSGSFYDFDYLGCYHRRHENNAANEEHKISKRLQFDTKLRDLEHSVSWWRAFSLPEFGLSSKGLKIAKRRLSLHEKRKKALLERSFLKVLALYLFDFGRFLRPSSFLCDLYLVLLGNKLSVNNEKKESKR